MEEKINTIYELIKELYPDAVLVTVEVNSQGIEVNPRYKTNVKGFTMRTISDKWVKSIR